MGFFLKVLSFCNIAKAPFKGSLCRGLTKFVGVCKLLILVYHPLKCRQRAADHGVRHTVGCAQIARTSERISRYQEEILLKLCFFRESYGIAARSFYK